MKYRDGGSPTELGLCIVSESFFSPTPGMETHEKGLTLLFSNMPWSSSSDRVTLARSEGSPIKNLDRVSKFWIYRS